ncbi:hypothetical protein HK405_008293 [Cladochytrium tenue]|nr:hypothetical protein HK405_008293 [Cladochytrium tenue]
MRARRPNSVVRRAPAGKVGDGGGGAATPPSDDTQDAQSKISGSVLAPANHGPYSIDDRPGANSGPSSSPDGSQPDYFHRPMQADFDASSSCDSAVTSIVSSTVRADSAPPRALLQHRRTMAPATSLNRSSQPVAEDPAEGAIDPSARVSDESLDVEINLNATKSSPHMTPESQPSEKALTVSEKFIIWFIADGISDFIIIELGPPQHFSNGGRGFAAEYSPQFIDSKNRNDEGRRSSTFGVPAISDEYNASDSFGYDGEDKHGGDYYSDDYDEMNTSQEGSFSGASDAEARMALYGSSFGLRQADDDSYYYYEDNFEAEPVEHDRRPTFQEHPKLQTGVYGEKAVTEEIQQFTVVHGTTATIDHARCLIQLSLYWQRQGTSREALRAALAAKAAIGSATAAAAASGISCDVVGDGAESHRKPSLVRRLVEERRYDELVEPTIAAQASARLEAQVDALMATIVDARVRQLGASGEFGRAPANESSERPGLQLTRAVESIQSPSIDDNDDDDGEGSGGRGRGSGRTGRSRTRSTSRSSLSSRSTSRSKGTPAPSEGRSSANRSTPLSKRQQPSSGRTSSSLIRSASRQSSLSQPSSKSVAADNETEAGGSRLSVVPNNEDGEAADDAHVEVVAQGSLRSFGSTWSEYPFDGLDGDDAFYD